MYQPQVEAWKGDELRAYAALSLESKTNKTAKYGVVWFTARTEVDKVNRQVTLDNFQITTVKFPVTLGGLTLSIQNVSIASNAGLLTTTSGPTITVQFAVVALDPTTGISGQINFAVHP
jgi:hypothetical protein